MATEPSINSSIGADVSIKLIQPRYALDWATITGLFVAIALIGMALVMGGSVAAFFNVPALFIVIGGTIAVTTIAYSPKDLTQCGAILKKAVVYRRFSQHETAMNLMEVSVLAKKRGILALTEVPGELGKDPIIYKSIQYVIDGYRPEEVARLLAHENDSAIDRHRRGAGIIRKAADVAPAMGLIGTLVGLVQMLTKLQDPSSIGPNMAIALLTTFYGAILSTVFLSPLASKLERNMVQENIIRDLVMTAVVSIAAQETPRRIEMLLNAALPPSEKIQYFD